MKTVLERLLDYSSFDTQSDETTGTHPSTAKQRKLAEHLAEELRTLKLENVRVTPECYVYAELPATSGFEHADALGFIAHMDTSDGASGANVHPQIIRNWDGSPIRLGSSGLELNTTLYPFMKDLIGHTLVTTDGTTLLGADDKAGIAEIITAAEILLGDRTLRHGKIRIGFTPDEEIGRGADLFDVARFGAKYAYTVDGGKFGEVEYETFNAASLKVIITGKSIHPGGAKDKMINASMVALEYASMLPELERPEHTEGYQGFYHLTSMSGSVESAVLSYILRDHDAAKLEGRKDYARRAADELNRRYGEGTVRLEIKDSYRNMREMIEPEFHLIENACNAVRRLGGEPISSPVRGGTDGSRLSFMGLPCPNLGTGSHNHHGRMEFACAEAMDDCVRLIIEIAGSYADM